MREEAYRVSGIKVKPGASRIPGSCVRDFRGFRPAFPTGVSD
jgi:hypothetical protein